MLKRTSVWLKFRKGSFHDVHSYTILRNTAYKKKPNKVHLVSFFYLHLLGFLNVRVHCALCHRKITETRTQILDSTQCHTKIINMVHGDLLLSTLFWTVELYLRFNPERRKICSQAQNVQAKKPIILCLQPILCPLTNPLIQAVHAYNGLCSCLTWKSVTFVTNKQPIGELERLNYDWPFSDLITANIEWQA